MLTKRTDPRYGVETVRVTELVRQEPFSALFTTPDEYKLFKETVQQPWRKVPALRTVLLPQIQYGHTGPRRESRAPASVALQRPVVSTARNPLTAMKRVRPS